MASRFTGFWRNKLLRQGCTVLGIGIVKFETLFSLFLCVKTWSNQPGNPTIALPFTFLFLFYPPTLAPYPLHTHTHSLTSILLDLFFTYVIAYTEGDCVDPHLFPYKERRKPSTESIANRWMGKIPFWFRGPLSFLSFHMTWHYSV